MHRYFAQIAYKGSAYHGWQEQPNALTVQELVNKALSTVTRQKVDTTGCGRTDTGVHASQFFLHFDLDSPIDDVEKALFQLNALLPHDIRTYLLIEVEATSHARFDAIKRSYSYYIFRKPSAFLQEFGWYFNRPLELEKMNTAAHLCLNHVDYACFGKSGGQQFTNNCTITECKWIEEGEILRFTVSANRFLRGMVRAMVGTFIDVGLNKISIEDFKTILENGDRGQAGQSVPPQGLFLEEIVYPYINSKRVYYLNL